MVSKSDTLVDHSKDFRIDTRTWGGILHPPVYPTKAEIDAAFDQLIKPYQQEKSIMTPEIKYAVFAYDKGPRWEAVSDFLYDTFEEAVQAAEKDYATWQPAKIQILSTCAYVERPAPVVRRVN